ncbi:OPT oligopeptide transporter [Cantharellus anzutake]|uniref:OPT oligopeptide transporter n=1 Tax=Cantharellus anzutake TaxID=1750568 RepID=UPI0019030D69|nr:OPT oligopeptide transporter [Cantharellus anzutake]KAF8342569.1 OPT oligopeptide transporter [Cantharellus anzutake]
MGEDSPYPEVRAAVSNLDDPTMPANTFRMWILGLLFTIIIAGLNQFFSLRYPSVTITALIAQLLALPCGKVMELVLPTTEFKILGCKFSLNPGPFNIKEHVLITVMANVVWGRAYATEVVAAQWKIYGQSWGFGYQMLLVLSTQLLGFSFGGLLRRFLVWPASMIWPQTLVYAALFNTLHSTYGGFDDGRLSRERFFSYVLVASFLWYWVPGYLFTALSTFNFICWAAPNNVVVNQLFGYTSGLGINIITFDWSMIAYIGSPLVTPWWAEVNVFASLLVIFWILCPVLYYSNVFYGAYLPISGNDAFDKFAHIYNSTIIMSPSGTFNRTAYDHYSPIYIPMTFALSYGMSFAALTATLVHTWLWHREEIMQQFQSSLDKEPDVHARLMLAYPEVPQWYYLTIGAVSFALGVVAITVWDTQLPIWAFIVAIFVALFYAVPIGMVEAITNVQVGLNVFTELIIGYALPGKPVAMMIFKTFGYITMTQALSFTSDLKLGHYMKIPPRLMFTVQTIATIVAAFVSVLVQDWCLANIADICDPQQSDKFTCPHIKVFGVASLIFGSVGPQRTFSHGAIYYPLLYFFVIGAFIPILFYYLSWKYPESWYKYFNAPVFFTGTGAMPPASGINFSSWALVGFIFQYWIRRRHFRWWSSYNYILSAALDSGVAIGVVVIFFSLSLAKGGLTLNWVGNTINDNTADARGAPFKTLSPGRSFGP